MHDKMSILQCEVVRCPSNLLACNKVDNNLLS